MSQNGIVCIEKSTQINSILKTRWFSSNLRFFTCFLPKKILKSQHLVFHKMTYWPSSMFCTPCFSTWPWMTQPWSITVVFKKICSMWCNIYTNANITCIYLYHKNYIYIYLFILIYLFNRDELGIFHINLAFFKWFGYPLTRRRRSRNATHLGQLFHEIRLLCHDPPS